MIAKLIVSVAILSVLVFISCSGGGVESTFEKMRNMACSGNVEGFFNYVDKDAVKESFKHETLDKFTQNASESMLAERSQGMSKQYKRTIMSGYMKSLWGNYKHWVELGESGPLCKMEITKTKGDSVTINIPGHPDVIWGFQKSDEGWELVSIL